MTYRLDVVATSVADAVDQAGGWLFDHALAGWEVTVFVAAMSDARPLHILGAEVAELDSVRARHEQSRRWHAPGAGGICDRDALACWGLLPAMGNDAVEVVMWDGGPRSPIGYRADLVLHRLSAAARVFKTQALVAAALPMAEAGAIEIFRSEVSILRSMSTRPRAAVSAR
ncbi:hypothetical protein ACFQZZ_25195 [Nocardia sp. GCM10030253]|uniref:hypothetical protein n=1 Tax=Nocardia sp. GCM10030253 TaxID=3273404 RepID=UPI00363AFA5F